MSRGPTETSHWVDDERRLLASAYPGDRDDDTKHVAKIKRIVAAGITHVVSLQPQDEADRCRPYVAHLPASVVHERFPIVDRAAAPSSEALWELAGRIDVLLQNKTNRVMVHCLGGHGRTGLVVSVYLARRHGLSADVAIRMNDRLHGARESQGATKHATLTAPQRRQTIALCHAKATARAVAKKPVVVPSPSFVPAPVDKASFPSSSSLSSSASPSPATAHRRTPIPAPRARVPAPASNPTPPVATSRQAASSAAPSSPSIAPPPILYTSRAMPPISSSTSTAVWPLSLFSTSPPNAFSATSTTPLPISTPPASAAPQVAPATTSRPPPLSLSPLLSPPPPPPSYYRLPVRVSLPPNYRKKLAPFSTGGGGGDGGGSDDDDDDGHEKKDDYLLFYGHRGRAGAVGPYVLSQFWMAPFLGDCVETAKVLLRRSCSSAEPMSSAVRSAIAFRYACLRSTDAGSSGGGGGGGSDGGLNRDANSKRKRAMVDDDGGDDDGETESKGDGGQGGDGGGARNDGDADTVRRKKLRTSTSAKVSDDASAGGDDLCDDRNDEDQAVTGTQSGPTTREFVCAEQWMMASKAVVFGDRPRYDAIMRERQPAAIKRLGRRVKSFDAAVWDRVRVAIVECGNWLKFSQNPALGAYLRSISASHIGEASPTDKVWGIGLGAAAASQVPSSEWPGENLLGRVLERTRAKLRRVEQRKKSGPSGPPTSASSSSSSSSSVAP